MKPGTQNTMGTDGETRSTQVKQVLPVGFTAADRATGAPVVDRPPFRTGDSILHKPSGEIWVCAWADPETGYLSWLGWPPGEAKILDFELAEAATDDLHRKRLSHLKQSGRRDAEKALRLYGDPDAEEAAHG